MTIHQPIEPAPDAFPMWTIYDHPTDAPDVFIARKWLVSGAGAVATLETLTDPKLEILRARMRLAGLTRIPRQPADDPVILESWM